MPLKDVTELSDAEAPASGSTGEVATAPPPKNREVEEQPTGGGGERDGGGEQDSAGGDAAAAKSKPMKAMKAKAKAKGKAKAKQTTKKPSASPASLKRPAAADKEVIKTHKSYYKKPQRFGIKVTPPGRELVYAP